MTLSLEQKEQLIQAIKQKEKQLKRRNLSINTGSLWCKAIMTILNGGSFQTVLENLDSFPQDSWFVA